MTRTPSRTYLLVAVAFAAAHVQPARALVVAGATAANAIAPVDNPGWANVGDNAIYIDNGWVLTAFHAGVNPVTFDGAGPFMPQPGTAFRLKNPTGMGLSTYTDLLMYRLTTDPGLPGLPLASATPAVGEKVMLIGDGKTAPPGTPVTSWVGTEVPADPDWVESNVNPNYFGYKSNVLVKSWGANLVEDIGTLDPDTQGRFNIGFGHVITFGTRFDDPAGPGSTGTGEEAQAQAFDSGSGVFRQVDGVWQLAGVTDAIGTFVNQPNASPANAQQPTVTQTAVFGNATFYVDLSFYRDQILAVPEARAYLLMSTVAITAGLGRIIARRRAK